MSKLTPEDVVLRYSKRGMNILKKYLKDGYCRTAAEKLLHAERGTVLLTTGFMWLVMQKRMALLAPLP